MKLAINQSLLPGVTGSEVQSVRSALAASRTERTRSLAVLNRILRWSRHVFVVLASTCLFVVG